MHCIKRANEQKESKEALFARILMLCEDDTLEAAEPYMNKLSEQYPKDPFVAILRGLFEHLMEEVEDAQSIWQQQFDTINVRNQDEQIRQEDEEKAEVEEQQDEEL